MCSLCYFVRIVRVLRGCIFCCTRPKATQIFALFLSFLLSLVEQHSLLNGLHLLLLFCFNWPYQTKWYAAEYKRKKERERERESKAVGTTKRSEKKRTQRAKNVDCTLCIICSYNARTLYTMHKYKLRIAFKYWTHWSYSLSIHIVVVVVVVPFILWFFFHSYGFLDGFNSFTALRSQFSLHCCLFAHFVLQFAREKYFVSFSPLR